MCRWLHQQHAVSRKQWLSLHREGSHVACLRLWQARTLAAGLQWVVAAIIVIGAVAMVTAVVVIVVVIGLCWMWWLVVV